MKPPISPVPNRLKEQRWDTKAGRYLTTLEDVKDAWGNLIDAEMKLTNMVREVNANGTTWQEIGRLFGMTRQGAWDRFALK